MYTITVRDQDRNRTKWLVFPFHHQAKTWMLVNGFFDGYNPFTHETVELKRRFQCSHYSSPSSAT